MKVFSADKNLLTLKGALHPFFHVRMSLLAMGITSQPVNTAMSSVASEV